MHPARSKPAYRELCPTCRNGDFDVLNPARMGFCTKQKHPEIPIRWKLSCTNYDKVTDGVWK